MSEFSYPSPCRLRTKNSADAPSRVAVALGQVAAVVLHIVGDIHLDAAEVVHHFGEGLHIDRDVVVHRQLVLVVDHLGQGGDAAAVGQGHRVDLVVGGAVGLAAGEGDGAVLGGHQGVAGDLQHPQRAVLDIELAVEDHVGHAVVTCRRRRSPALLIVDAADQDVHHIPLVLPPASGSPPRWRGRPTRGGCSPGSG